MIKHSLPARSPACSLIGVVRPSDVMSNVRRLERKGLVYVRGYRGVGRETPFREGYIITWIDPSKPREQAISEAFERTERTLAEKATPIVQRVQAIRDGS